MDEKEKDPLDPDNDLEICQEMENNFAKIVSELFSDRSLDKFRKEYEMLHEALVQSHEHNKVLMEKCRSLNQDIVANANKISSVLQLSQNDQRTIAGLRREFERAWLLVQNSQDRESHSEEVIFNLNQEITNLKFLIDSANASNQSNIGNEVQISMQDAQDALNIVKSDLEVQQNQTASLCKQIENTMTETNKMENETIKLKEEFKKLSEADKSVSEELDKVSKERIEILDSCFKGSEDIKTETTRSANIKYDIKNIKSEIRERKRIIVQCEKDKEMLHELTSHVRIRFSRLNEKLSDAKSLTKGTASRIEGKREQIHCQEEELINSNNELNRILSDHKNIIDELSESKKYRRNLNDEKEKSFRHLQDLRQEQIVLSSKVNSVLLNIRNRNFDISESSNEHRLIQQRVKFEETEQKKAEMQIHLIESNLTGVKSEVQNERERGNDFSIAINKYKSEKFFQDTQTGNVIEQVSELKKQIEKSDQCLKEKHIESKRQAEIIKDTQEERDKIIKEVQKVEKENVEVDSQIKIQKALLEKLKEEARVKDEDCILLHISHKKTLKLMKELTIKKNEYANQLKELTEKEKYFFGQVQCSNHILDQAYKDIENKKFELKNGELQNRDIVKEFERKKEESEKAVEKNRVLASLIRIGGHKYSQIVDKVEGLKTSLMEEIDKNNKLFLLLRGQNEARYEIRRLQKEIVHAQGQIKAMEEEFEMPRNVHRWRLLESSDPVQYQYVMMRLQLLNDITKSISASEKVKLIEKSLREKFNKIQKNAKNSYGGNYDEEMNILNMVYKEKEKQLKSLQEQFFDKRPKVEDEKNKIDELRSMIRSSKIESSEDQKRINQQKMEDIKQDANQKPDFVKPPKYAPTQRPRARYIGGGFEVERFVNDLKFAPKPPQVSMDSSRRGPRKRKQNSCRNDEVDLVQNIDFNLPEVRIKKSNKKSALERMNAVIVPSTSSSNAGNGSSLSASSNSSSLRRKKAKKTKNNSNYPNSNSNWSPTHKNSSRRHFVAKMKNDCL